MARLITSINTLADTYFKSCNFSSPRNVPLTERLVTESGIPANNIRYYDLPFVLVIQAITRDQILEIMQDFIETERRSMRAIISKSKITDHGYIDFKATLGDPEFLFSVDEFTVSRLASTDLWILSIPLYERIEVEPYVI